MTKTSIKLSDETKTFLKNLKLNRIKTDTDKDILGYADLADIIVKYFKLNNERYLELVKLKVDKNV